MGRPHEPETTQPTRETSAKSAQSNHQKHGALVRWLFKASAASSPGHSRRIPLHAKTDPVPHLSNWNIERWVLLHAFFPVLLHQLYATATGTNLGPIAAFILYGIAFTAIGTHEIFILNRLGYIYGYFDGEKHVRDSLARIGGARPIAALLGASTLRPLLIVWLLYDRNVTPIATNWIWLPVEIGLYGLVFDFWFYCHHRLMHDSRLWANHKTHHLAKHPSPLLSLHTGLEEWIMETAGQPVLTLLCLRCMGFPMGFYEFWACEVNILWFELAAHGGIRVDAAAPTPFIWLLRRFNADQSIEDHDLHHRAGWKQSYNYGKQSRLWDRLFGTSRGRIESVPDNIDYSKPASFPLL